VETAFELLLSQVLTAQEEPVYDFPAPAEQQGHIAEAAANLDAPFRMAEIFLQRIVVGGVHVAAHEAGVAAEAGKIGAELNDIAAVRLNPAEAAPSVQ